MSGVLGDGATSVGDSRRHCKMVGELAMTRLSGGRGDPSRLPRV
jgi:hypothetical protein